MCWLSNYKEEMDCLTLAENDCLSCIETLGFSFFHDLILKEGIQS
jgi:hypothetical protein